MENQSFEMRNKRPAVPSIGRAVRLLEAVAREPGALGISALSRRTGLSKSSVHGLVSALADEDLLTAGGSGLTLGPRLLRLGHAAADHRLLTAAGPIMHTLSEEIGESIMLGRVDGTRVDVIATEESAQPVSLSAPVGSSLPLAAGALGRAYAAHTDAHTVPVLLRRYTERSITDVDRFSAEVERVRQAGYATDRGEYLAGVAAAAAAFSLGRRTYLLWMVAIEASGVDLDEVGAAIREAARAIEEAAAAGRG
ncbi:MAG TPA: IclR family transcriptional regulator [Chloroflexota bacterium]|nr:IclR family transcriptional regulator [Chloroflexota bacterium]